MAAALGSCSEVRLASPAPVPPHVAAWRPVATGAITLPPDILADLSNMSPAQSSGTDAPSASPMAVLPTAAGPAAQPFRLVGRPVAERGRAEFCLASAIYYEAASESDDGERAVAQVVLNRVRHPAFPASVCGVVYQGSENLNHCQFSFACDGSMARHRVLPAEWARASRIAAAALGGAVFKPVGLAINYHTLWVAPRWSPALVPAAVIGAHIFYRLQGPAGAAAAFGQAYAAREPVPGPHPQLAPLTPPAEPASLLAAAALARPSLSVTPVNLPRPAAAEPVAAAETPPAITPEDHIQPRWRESGTWLTR